MIYGSSIDRLLVVNRQNERQPHYNTLAQGDTDTMRSFLNFYLRMLPYVSARTKAQFKGTDAPELTGIAALYEETCTQFGTCNYTTNPSSPIACVICVGLFSDTGSAGVDIVRHAVERPRVGL